MSAAKREKRDKEDEEEEGDEVDTVLVFDTRGRRGVVGEPCTVRGAEAVAGGGPPPVRGLMLASRADPLDERSVGESRT